MEWEGRRERDRGWSLGENEGERYRGWSGGKRKRDKGWSGREGGRGIGGMEWGREGEG